MLENCYDVCSWSLYKLNNYGCFNFPQMFLPLNPRSFLLPYPEFLPASTWFQTSSIHTDQNWAQLSICWCFNSVHQTASFLLFMHPSKVVPFFFLYLITNNGVEFFSACYLQRQIFSAGLDRSFTIEKFYGLLFFFVQLFSTLPPEICPFSSVTPVFMRSSWILNSGGLASLISPHLHILLNLSRQI